MYAGFLENIPTHPSSHVSLHHRDDNSRRPVEQHPSPSRRSQTLRGVGSSEPRMADKGRTLSETGHPLQILRTSRLHAPYSQTSYRSLSQSRDKLRNLPPRSNTIPGPNEDRQPSSFAHLMSSDMPSSQSRSLPSDRGHLSSDTPRLIDHRGRNDPFEVVRFQHPPQSHQSINELSHPAPLFERMERGNLHSSDLTRRHSLEGTPIASTSTAPDIGAAPYRRFTKNFGPMIEPLRSVHLLKIWVLCSPGGRFRWTRLTQTFNPTLNRCRNCINQSLYMTPPSCRLIVCWRVACFSTSVFRCR